MLSAIVAMALGSSILSGVPMEGQNEKDARMKWWREARFGLFIHWGLYSIPAGKWGENTGHGEWIRETAQIPVETYEQFRGQFNPVKFDADAWVKMAKDAGMKYIVITTKHHDGFGLFDSKYTDWDVMSTPFHRDIMKELAAACKRQGLKMCWYHSIMDWHHPDYLPRRTWEEKMRPAAGADMDRFTQYLFNQVTELLTNYGDIGVMWFDGEWESTWNHTRGKALYELCRRLQPNVIVNNRVDVGREGLEGMTSDSDRKGDFGTPEQTIPDTGMPGKDWESCMTMNQHWGYNAKDLQYKSSKQLVQMLCDISSKGGNFLLNIGPTSEGEFPKESRDRLRDLGTWTNENGDAIYGTSASPFGKLPWGRCTMRKNGANTMLYLHVFDWPTNGELVVGGLGNEVRRAFPLGTLDAGFPVERRESDVVIKVPSKPLNDYASVITLDIEGDPIVYSAPEIVAMSSEFVKPMQVELKSTSRSLQIKYTTDGKNPTSSSATYLAPITIVKNTTVKARVFHKGKPVSAVTEREFKKVQPWPAMQNAVGSAGLRGEVFEGNWNEMPDFAKMKATSTRNADIVGLGDLSTREYVGLKLTGTIEVPADDVYRFILGSDDGSRLWLDGKVVVNHDGLHSMDWKDGFAPLKSGPHKITVEWFNKTGGADLQLMWAAVSKDAKPQPVPKSAFRH